MVLTVDTDVTAARRVLDAAAGVWSRIGATPVETPLQELAGVPGSSVALVIPEHGMVECIGDGDHGAVAVAARRLSAEGWTVAVLVPAPGIGAAHRALRGVPVRIQPWWTGAGGAVLFGVPEVP